MTPDMLIKTYQYRAYPTQDQIKQLHYRMWQCRKLWNQALEAKRLVYQIDDYTMTHFDLSRRFCSEKKGIIDYQVMPYDTTSWVLQRLDDAYNAAFRRLKENKVPGFPRFKGRDDWNSIPQRRPSIKLLNNKRFAQVAIGSGKNKLWLKFRYHRPLPDMAELQWAVITETNGEWYVNIQLRYPHVKTAHLNPMFAIGVDMGLTHFVTLSTGEYVDLPDMEYNIKAMRRIHRKRSRRGKFVQVTGKQYPAKAKDQSQRWHRINNQSNALYRQQKRRRDYFVNQVIAELTNTYQVICIEDISPQFMIHNKRLARQAAQVAWSSFMSRLAAKCYEKGVELIKVPPQYSSQTCHECGCIHEDNRLNQSLFHCIECGHEANADINAALNILHRGLEIRKSSVAQNVVRVAKHKRRAKAKSETI